MLALVSSIAIRSDSFDIHFLKSILDFIIKSPTVVKTGIEIPKSSIINVKESLSCMRNS